MNQQLTRRELQILELTSFGYSAKEVSIDLGISVDTVEAHQKSIHSKTGLQKATELEMCYIWSRYRLPLLDIPLRMRRRIFEAEKFLNTI